MFLLEPYEVFFGLRPENSGFIENARFVVGWGNVMLTWTVEMAAAAAELSVMTSSP